MTTRAEARERIIRAAVRTLATQGYAATTARSVAKTGGFAPGVIYYHFEDLEDLLIAAARYTSERRLERYKAELTPVASAAQLLERLRALHREDVSDGHISAVQELAAAASSSPRLAAGIQAQLRPWEDFAEAIVRRFVDDTPLAGLVPARDLASAAIALFIGMEMLSHLNTDGSRAEALFEAARPVADLVDAMRPPGGPAAP